MHTVWAILSDVFRWIAGLTFVGFMIYTRYRMAQSAEERKEHKANIETLFGGKEIVAFRWVRLRTAAGSWP